MLHKVFLIVGAPVELVVALGLEETGVQIEPVLEAVAEAGAAGIVAVTVVVGLKGGAASGLCYRAAAGIESPGIQATCAQVEPAALAASRDPARELIGGVAAAAGAESGSQRTTALAREELDDTANGLGAVEARARATHDLDALDLVDRDQLQGRLPRGGGADADPVDEDEHMAGIRTPQEHGGLLAEATAIGDLQTGHPAQDLVDRLHLAALDLFARNDGDRGQGLIRRLGGAGRGYDDRLQLGRLFGGEQGATRQGSKRQQDCRNSVKSHVLILRAHPRSNESSRKAHGGGEGARRESKSMARVPRHHPPQCHCNTLQAGLRAHKRVGTLGRRLPVP